MAFLQFDEDFASPRPGFCARRCALSDEDADDEVITRARAGDQRAWAELYEAHAGRLVLWLGSLRHADTAAGPEDVAADAWLTAARRIADFTGDSNDFAGWLFGIARNLTANANRRAARRGTDPSAFETGNTLILGIAEDPLAQISDADSIRRLLAHLSQREAEVVACLDVVGLDTATTAAALGISHTAVRVAHHRALGRLRKHLS